MRLVKKSSEEYRSNQKNNIKTNKQDNKCREGDQLFKEAQNFVWRSNRQICNLVHTVFEYQVKINAIKLQKLYSIDLAVDLQEKCVLLKQFLTSHENKMSSRQLYLFIKQNNFDIHHYLYTADTNLIAEHLLSALNKMMTMSLTNFSTNLCIVKNWNI